MSRSRDYDPTGTLARSSSARGRIAKHPAEPPRECADREAVSGPAKVCNDVGVIDRLSASDSSFLYLEDASAATHVGQVLIFVTPDGFRSRHVSEAIRARLDVHPRYRQRIHTLPGRFITPVWVDDPDSVSYTHLRAHETVLDLVCRLLLEKKKIPHA